MSEKEEFDNNAALISKKSNEKEEIDIKAALITKTNFVGEKIELKQDIIKGVKIQAFETDDKDKK